MLLIIHATLVPPSRNLSLQRSRSCCTTVQCIDRQHNTLLAPRTLLETAATRSHVALCVKAQGLPCCCDARSGLRRPALALPIEAPLIGWADSTTRCWAATTSSIRCHDIHTPHRVVGPGARCLARRTLTPAVHAVLVAWAHIEACATVVVILGCVDAH
jgi:hypothetical protein